MIVGDADVNRVDVHAERVHRDVICVPPSSNRYVDCGTLAKRWKKCDPDKLSQSALEPVSIDGRVLVSRYHDCHAGKGERGSEDPHVEMRSPNSLPLANYGLDVATPRQSVATRKSKAVRRLRTCSGV